MKASIFLVLCVVLAIGFQITRADLLTTLVAASSSTAQDISTSASVTGAAQSTTVASDIFTTGDYNDFYVELDYGSYNPHRRHDGGYVRGFIIEE
jgi:hypothetical protein